MPLNQSKFKLPLFTLLIAALIFVLSILPSDDLPKQGWLNFPGVDKLVHFLMYFTLTLVFSAETGYRRILPGLNLLLIALLAAVYSGTIELIQMFFTSTREGDWLDLLANITGIVFAAACSSLLHHFRFGPFRGFRETPRPDRQ